MQTATLTNQPACCGDLMKPLRVESWKPPRGDYQFLWLYVRFICLGCGDSQTFCENPHEVDYLGHEHILLHTKPYQSPKIEKVSKMTFPMDMIEAAGKGTVCRQCSSCHGCR